MDTVLTSPKELNSLAQHGLGPEDTFNELVGQNPFLFRVYTPRRHSLFVDSSDPFFLGQSFDESFTLVPEKLSDPSSQLCDISFPGTYADVTQHMEWTTRAFSPFISTSFSFVWALWEAVRRYRVNVKHDVEIAVIDARALVGRAVTAAELLRKGALHERHQDHTKWYRFAIESQDVLVYESIPRTAIYASLPLLYVLERLPSYFLRSDFRLTVASPFDRLAWTQIGSKPSFRQFRREISERFLDMPTETELRDVTVGPVRLAISLLRPWFHEELPHDPNNVTDTLCKLSSVLAQWPGQWWTRNRSEIWDIIRATVQVLVEEIQARDKAALEESTLEESRIRTVVGDLEPLSAPFDMHSSFLGCSSPRKRVLSMSESSVTTSDAADDRSVHTLVEVVELPDAAEMIGDKRIAKLTDQADTSMQTSSPTAALLLSSALRVRAHRPAPLASPFLPSDESFEDTLSDSSTEASLSDEDENEDENGDENEAAAVESTPECVPVAAKQAVDKANKRVMPSVDARPHSMAETASCVVTGLLFGAFIALCIMSSQRRALATHVY